MTNSQPVRQSNRGGGYVEDVRVMTTPAGGHRLEFRGPAGSVVQIGQCDRSYAPERRVAPQGVQRLRSSRNTILPITRSLLTILGDVLTLPTAANVDFALAIDWYKTPVDGISPSEWPNTSTADLVSRGKYAYRDPRNREK